MTSANRDDQRQIAQSEHELAQAHVLPAPCSAALCYNKTEQAFISRNLRQ